MFQDPSGDGLHFDEFAKEYGAVFKEKKRERGTTLVILGVQFNFVEKTCRLAPEKADSIKAVCLEVLAKKGGTPNQIGRLVGKLENAAQISRYGRARLFNLSRLLAKFGPIFGVDGHEKTGHISIDAGCAEELKFWADISNHPSQNFSQVRRRHFSTVSSDASGSSWAYVFDGVEVGDKFPPELAAGSINQKEAYALYRLIDGLSRQNSTLSVCCDNQAAVSSYSKTRSRSEDIHRWVLKSQEILVEKNMSLEIKWFIFGVGVPNQFG